MSAPLLPMARLVPAMEGLPFAMERRLRLQARQHLVDGQLPLHLTLPPASLGLRLTRNEPAPLRLGANSQPPGLSHHATRVISQQKISQSQPLDLIDRKSVV